MTFQHPEALTGLLTRPVAASAAGLVVVGGVSQARVGARRRGGDI